MVSGGGLRDGGPRAAPRGEAFDSQLGTSNCGSPVGQRALARARQSDHEFREDAGLGRGLNRAPMLLDDDVVAEPDMGEMKQFYMVMGISSCSEAILSFRRANLAAANSPS